MSSHLRCLVFLALPLLARADWYPATFYDPWTPVIEETAEKQSNKTYRSNTPGELLTIQTAKLPNATPLLASETLKQCLQNQNSNNILRIKRVLPDGSILYYATIENSAPANSHSAIGLITKREDTICILQYSIYHLDNIFKRGPKLRLWEARFQLPTPLISLPPAVYADAPLVPILDSQYPITTALQSLLTEQTTLDLQLHTPEYAYLLVQDDTIYEYNPATSSIHKSYRAALDHNHFIYTPETKTLNGKSVTVLKQTPKS